MLTSDQEKIWPLALVNQLKESYTLLMLNLDDALDLKVHVYKFVHVRGKKKSEGSCFHSQSCNIL